MTPVYLNPPPPPPPFVELKEEQYLQLSLSVPQQAASWLSVDHHPTFFNTAKPEESNHDHHHKVNTYDGGSGDHHQASASSSLQYAVDHSAANCHQHLSFSRKEDGDSESASDRNNGSSVKWMPSKTRLMKMMMKSNCSTTTGSANHNKAVKFTSKFQYLMHDDDETNSFGKTSNTIRVCSDCNTTTTPLWRSGPRGPKSLCNACGIRQRKARRAMEAATSAAANGAAVATGATISMKIKVHNKKELKKSRTTSHAGQFKKHHQFKAAAPHSDHNSHYQQNQEKLRFKEFALSLDKNSSLQRVFPQDVEDAAILLMELSCGLVHS